MASAPLISQGPTCPAARACNSGACCTCRGGHTGQHPGYLTRTNAVPAITAYSGFKLQGASAIFTSQSSQSSPRTTFTSTFTSTSPPHLSLFQPHSTAQEHLSRPFPEALGLRPHRDRLRAGWRTVCLTTCSALGTNKRSLTSSCQTMT